VRILSRRGSGFHRQQRLDPHRIATGSRGQFGTRNAPTLMYALYSPPFSFVTETGADGTPATSAIGGQFWDGRAATLIEQAMGQLLDPLEMNNTDRAQVIKKIQAGASAALFRALYGDDAFLDVDAAYQNMVHAIATFEQSERFHPFSSKFDDFLRGKVALDENEAHGFALFKDPEKGNCTACHVGDPNSHNSEDWIFTDFSFDNLGVPRNHLIPANIDSAHYDLGLCARPDIKEKVPNADEELALCGAFKVPTLRNVELTAPYFHNGVVKELRDVVRFHVTRDTNPELWYPVAPDGSSTSSMISRSAWAPT